MIFRLVIAALFCSLSAIASWAAEPWRLTNPAALLNRLDTNKDGRIKAAEVPEDKRNIYRQLLRSADKNDDGALTKQELEEALDASATRIAPVKKAVTPLQMNPQLLIRRLDKNNNRQLELNEVPPAARGRFMKILEAADKNGNKALDGREVMAAAPLIAQLARAGRAKPKASPPRGDALFRLTDADGDGKLSPAEMQFFKRVLDEVSK